MVFTFRLVYGLKTCSVSIFVLVRRGARNGVLTIHGNMNVSFVFGLFGFFVMSTGRFWGHVGTKVRFFTVLPMFFNI